MKRLIGIFVCISGFLLTGCESQTTTAPYDYVEFQGDRYVWTEENTYQFEDQSIAVNVQETSTVITTSFLEGTVTVSSGGSVVIVDYPDGCQEKYQIVEGWAGQTRFVTEGHNHSSSLHLALSHVTVKSSADDPQEPVYLSWKRVGLIVLGGASMIVTGIFVFQPQKTEKLVVLENRIFPMFEEPVRPTELNLIRRYLGIVLAFLLGLGILLYGLLY